MKRLIFGTFVLALVVISGAMRAVLKAHYLGVLSATGIVSTVMLLFLFFLVVMAIICLLRNIEILYDN